MIQCLAKKSDGSKHILFGLQSLQINKDENAPADSLKMVLNGEITEQYTEISILKNNQIPLFVGIVDEQIISVSAEEIKTTFICRSREAILIDNEACPKSFINPSLGVLVKMYAKPLGFYLKSGDDFSVIGEYSVSKGISCWQAIDDFCKKYRGCSVLVKNADCICCGNTNTNQTLCTGLKKFSVKKNYAKQISGVYRQTNKSREYNAFFKNDEISGITRVRYQSAQCSISPQECISNGEREAISAKCILNGLQVCDCGNKVYLPQINIKSWWQVSAVRYDMSPEEESTLLVLK